MFFFVKINWFCTYLGLNCCFFFCYYFCFQGKKALFLNIAQKRSQNTPPCLLKSACLLNWFSKNMLPCSLNIDHSSNRTWEYVKVLIQLINLWMEEIYFFSFLLFSFLFLLSLHIWFFEVHGYGWKLSINDKKWMVQKQKIIDPNLTAMALKIRMGDGGGHPAFKKFPILANKTKKNLIQDRWQMFKKQD